MPSPFAFLMLLVWPFVALVLFRRLPPAQALIWTVLGGYLALPPLVAINLPVVPDLDKSSIPNLSAFVLALFLLKDRVSMLPEGALGKLLILCFVLGPFATVLTNDDPIRLAVGALPAMRIYDSVAAVVNQGIALLPFFLARRYLASAEALRALAVALLVAGLIYSIPMLIEVRLSPQMNVWIYGFFQHSFEQTMRMGGFRPIVFLPHGLWVAFFALMTVLATAMLARTAAPAERPKLVAALLYLCLLLVLCKSLGPIVYALGLLPLVLVAGRRMLLALAALMALVAVCYPLMRGLHLVPLEALLDIARGIDADRAGSLGFRFANEETLLAHAGDKPLFGWGGYGRNHVYDAETGRMLTIADGAWIISLGIYGWIGYIAQFGLLALPLLKLGAEALRRPAEAFSPFAAVIAVILGVNLIDMLPNATLIPFTWLMAGALLGHVESLARVPGPAVQAAAPLPPRRRTVL